MSRPRPRSPYRPWDGIDLRGAAVLALGVLVAVTASSLSAFRWDAPIASCAVAYDIARTARDTAEVDSRVGPGKLPFRETCGDFRRNGALAEYAAEHGR